MSTDTKIKAVVTTAAVVTAIFGYFVVIRPF